MKQHRKWTLALVCTLSASMALAAACGNAEIVVAPEGPLTPDAGDAQPDVSKDSDLLDVQGDSLLDSSNKEEFILKPANKDIDLSVEKTVQYQAVSTKTGQPISPTVWYLDSFAAGSIDSKGLFTASGQTGGVLTVSAETPYAKASTKLTLHLKVLENPGNIDAAVQAKLKAGSSGAPDAKFVWLYPYDQTVFPRGLLPPTLQFGGTGAEAYYLHVKSKLYEYEGFYGPSNPSRIAIADAVWKGISWSAGDQDPVSVSVTKLQGQNVTGPISETWRIAQGSLKGLVYYNTYDDPTATGGGTLAEEKRGAVMRIRPGQVKPDVLLGGDGKCTVCHSVSANGQVMALSHGHNCSQTYKLSPNAGAATPVYTDNQACPSDRHDDTFSFGGLSPNGDMILTSASMPRDPSAGIDFYPNIASIHDDTGQRDSKLIDTKTGQVLPAPGFDGVVHKALMPAFSPDGTRVAFTHYEAGEGHTLSVMSFNPTTLAFAALNVVYNSIPYGNDIYAGWPAFTPDIKSVVFQVGDRPDYSSWRGGSGRIFITDLSTKSEMPLYALNGWKDKTTPYLSGKAEASMSFEPTMLPVAVGGYTWVVFTSRRSYGNLINSYGDGPEVPTPADPSPKKLWVAAVDLHYNPTVDPSHPAFYLEGQDLVSGNMRGFWAMEPCKSDGNSCESGSECCEGFCRAVAGDSGTVFQCTKQTKISCAEEYEKCTTSADCCGVSQGYECINGYCASPGPVIK